MVMIPTLLLIIGVPWITNFRKRWKQAVSGLGVLLLLTYLLVLSPYSIRLEERLLVKPLPTDNGIKADAIVVLGRGQELRAERVAVAKQLWQAGRATTVFASGSGDAIEIGELLRQAGVPEKAVDGEPCQYRSVKDLNQFLSYEISKVSAPKYSVNWLNRTVLGTVFTNNGRKCKIHCRLTQTTKCRKDLVSHGSTAYATFKADV
jgi:hypothetical protein